MASRRRRRRGGPRRRRGPQVLGQPRPPQSIRGGGKSRTPAFIGAFTDFRRHPPAGGATGKEAGGGEAAALGFGRLAPLARERREASSAQFFWFVQFRNPA
jgi:hypothetical protein